MNHTTRITESVLITIARYRSSQVLASVLHENLNKNQAAEAVLEAAARHPYGLSTESMTTLPSQVIGDSCFECGL
jgi:hypothetical protein